MSTGDESPGGGLPVNEGLWWSGIAAAASFVVVLVVGGVILGAGLGDSNHDQAESSGPAEDQDLLEIGAETFARTCATCHGTGGEGGVGPALAGIKDRYPDIADQIAVVVGGRNAMPAFGSQLTDTQIDAVVAYEREVLDSSE